MSEFPDSLKTVLNNLGEHSNLVSTLEQALAEDLPLLARDGGFIREGFYPPLDEIKLLKNDSHKMIVELQNKYAEATGISNLKIKYNNVTLFLSKCRANLRRRCWRTKTLFIGSRC